MRVSINILLIVVVLSTMILSTEKTKAFSIGGNKKKDANRSKAVAITVNGVKITEGQIETLVDIRLAKRAGYAPGENRPPHLRSEAMQKTETVPENMSSFRRREMRKIVIWELVSRELIFQKGKQNHIAVSDKEVTKTINKIAAKEHLSFDEFKRKTETGNNSFAEYRRVLKAQLLFDKLLEKEYSDKLNPTDEQMKACYNKNIRHFSVPEKIHVYHIIVRPEEDSNDPNQARPAAKAKAQELLRKIRNGADFDTELAKSENEGSDLGMRRRGDLRFIDPNFEEAAFALKSGQISDVVETRYAFHIIKCVEHIDAHALSLEEVKEQVRQIARNELKERAYYEYGRRIMREADIRCANKQDRIGFESPPE